ncbi:MAG TPA: CBS domain-containing protein [Magnetovibrio sp.]
MAEHKTIDYYMTTDLVTLSPSDDIHVAMQELVDNRISGAPVLAGSGQLVGILTKKDCLNVVFRSSYHQDWAGRVEDFMKGPVETLEAGMPLIAAAEYFANSKYRRFPVLREGRMVGLISRHDILRALTDLWHAKGRS